jgi:hypothetical protein
MKKLSIEEFNELINLSSIKPRLKNEVRFIASTENLSDEEWGDRELIGISDRSGNNGILLVSLSNKMHILPYELKIGITSSATGRLQSTICDFCRTWQYGDRSARISFHKDKNSSVSFLCCADLKCSMHVRNKTEASHTSRAQLREDLSIEQRVERLKTRLANLVATLPVEPFLK